MLLQTQRARNFLETISLIMIDFTCHSRYYYIGGKEMSLKLRLLSVLVALLIFATPCVFGDDPKGTAYSRPNVSGGYDFYDSSGNKTGYSVKRTDGRYNYYDQYGNKAGFLKPGAEKGKYYYYDADNIRRGEFKSNPYGGYRYYEKKEGLETTQQKKIRRDYQYQDPYGSGVETLPPGVIKGKE